MKEIGGILLFFIAVFVIGFVFENIDKDRQVKIKQLDRQWKLDSTDKAERRKMDKDLETLRLKLQNESR